jgi:nitrate/nitrite transporter NarK
MITDINEAATGRLRLPQGPLGALLAFPVTLSIVMTVFMKTMLMLNMIFMWIATILAMTLWITMQEVEVEEKSIITEKLDAFKNKIKKKKAAIRSKVYFTVYTYLMPS